MNPAFLDADAPGEKSLDRCLQRVANAEARLKAGFSMVEDILQEVRTLVAECNGEQTFQEAAPVNAKPPAEDTGSARDEDNVLVGTGSAGDGDKELAGPKFSESLPQLPTEPELENVAVDATPDKHEQDLLALSEVHEEVARSLGINTDEVQRAYETFLEYDKDHSGKLDVTESRMALQSLTGRNLDMDSYHRILLEFDRDIDGFLSFEEFLFFYCHTPEKRLNHLAKFSSHVRFNGNRLSTRFRARVGGVKTSHVKDYVEEELSQMSACLKLPGAIFTFLLFFISCQLHANTAMVSGTDSAIKYHIEENANFAFSGAIPFENGRMGHKNIYDVNTPADFWSWFGIGLVPLVFPAPEVNEMWTNLAGRCTSPGDALMAAGFSLNGSDFPSSAPLMNDLGNICKKLESPTPASIIGRQSPFLLTQSIIAGVRLQQEQVPLSSCPQPDLQGHAFDGLCAQSSESWFEPELRQVMGMHKHLVDQPGAATEYFLAQSTQQEVLKRLMAMESNAWINQRTGKVEVVFTSYSPDTAILTATYIYFVVNRAGHMYKFIKPISFDLSLYSMAALYAVDALFYLSIAKIAIHEGQKLTRHWKRRGFKTGSYRYLSYARVIDWLVVVLSAVSCFYWVQECLVHSQLRHSFQSGDINIPGMWAHPANREDFFELVDRASSSSLQYQLLLSIFALVLGLRFFDAFSGQPRLALVTNTLRSASTDVIHFGVVVGSMLIVFSLSAQILFGFAMQDFGSYDRALLTLFKGMAEGLDTDELTKVDRTFANTWGVLFTILIQLLMLNMLLAIIFDVYAEVKSAVPPHAETFWSQAYEIFRRWKEKRLGERIDLQVVFESLEFNLSDKEFLTMHVMMQRVPGLSESQALRILTHADERAAELEATIESTQVSQHVLSLDLRIQQMQQMMGVLAERAESLAAVVGAAQVDVLVDRQEKVMTCKV